MITRRVRHRTFLLRPSEKTNEIVEYVVAVTARKYNIKIHAIKVLSNHWHVVMTDPDGNLSRFLCDCHSLIGRAINSAHGDEENLWAAQDTNKVECADPGDIIDEMAYTMANDVEAGLVRYGYHWPGVKRCWPDPPKTCKRPRYFFSSKMPEELELEMHRPPGFEDLSHEELSDLVKNAIHDREERFRAEADLEGRRFLGRRAVLAQSRYARPKTKSGRADIKPRIKARDKQRLRELIERNRSWDIDYAEALHAWRSGDRNVLFPYGTNKMRMVHDVRCASPP
jgi:REP element-mobilizing transposase RayT